MAASADDRFLLDLGIIFLTHGTAPVPFLRLVSFDRPAVRPRMYCRPRV
jgi:hypothetical protein